MVLPDFGDLQVIHFVCLATPEDLTSNAEYIPMADEVQRCQEAPNYDSASEFPSCWTEPISAGWAPTPVAHYAKVPTIPWSGDGLCQVPARRHVRGGGGLSACVHHRTERDGGVRGQVRLPGDD